MKALFGTTCHEFTHRLAAAAAVAGPGDIKGVLCRGEAGEYLLVPDKAAEGGITGDYLNDVEPDDHGFFIDGGRRMVTASRQTVASTGDLLPRCAVTRDTPGDDWYRDVLIGLASKKALTRIMEMLLVRDQYAMTLACLDTNDFPYILRVKKVAAYVLLFCLGEGVGEIFYQIRDNGIDLNYYAAWGQEFPLCRSRFIKPGSSAGRIILLRPDREPVQIAAALFESLDTYIIPAFSGTPAQSSILEKETLRLTIHVRLKTAEASVKKSLPPAELWLVPESRLDALKQDLFCPESTLSQLEALSFTLNGDLTYVAVWSGGSGRDLTGLFPATLASPDVFGFYRTAVSDLPLFLPMKTVLAPTLERATIESLFALKSSAFTLIIKTGDSKSIISLDISAFKPMKIALVDYEFSAHGPEIRTVLDNALYDFGEPVAYPEPELEKSGGPSQEIRREAPEDPSVPLPPAPFPGNAEPGIPLVRRAKEPEPDLMETRPEKREKIKRPKTHTELLQEKATDFITRYDRLTQQDWRRYMLNASYMDDCLGDALEALTTLLFFHPRTQVLDNICQALKMDPDWFWSRSSKKLMTDIFDKSWKARRPETTLFMLYGAKDRLIRGAWVLEDNSLRLALSELGRMIHRTGHPKLIWLFGRISREVAKDAEAVEKSRIEVQNRLLAPDSDPGIPKRIRQELTHRYMARQNPELTHKAALLELSHPGSLWFHCLTLYYLERHPVFTPDASQLKSLEALLEPENLTDIHPDTRQQLTAFVRFLNRCSSCPYPHPAGCSHTAHFDPNTDPFPAELITRLDQPFSAELSGFDEIIFDREDEAARTLSELTVSPDDPWSSILQLCLAALNGKKSGSELLIDAALRKTESFLKQDSDNSYAETALDLITALLQDKAAMGRSFSQAVQTLEAVPSHTGNAQILVSVLAAFISQGWITPETGILERLLKTMKPLCRISQNPSAQEEMASILIIWMAAQLIMKPREETLKTIKTILAAEKQRIREIVSREYGEQRK